LRLGIKVINPLPPASIHRLTFPNALLLAPHSGTGIFTCCPSPALFSLGLGPTHPTRTDLPSEPLDVRRMGFSPIFRYSCLHSHFHALQRLLPRRLHRTCNAPLPFSSLASVRRFSPVTLSAQSRSTSELLRTLSRVAASKPTSWLSPHDHIVSH
jgi:hypothetical protein